jgi:biotin carboxyl carrier protein
VSTGDPTLVVAPVVGPVDTDASAAGAGVLAQRHALVAGEDGVVSMVALDATRHRLRADAVTTDVILEPARTGGRGVVVREVLVDGFRFDVESELERLASLRERATRERPDAAHGGPLEIRAVIPGRLVALWVASGDTVTAGERMLAIEAMKMQNELLAPRDGTIVTIGVAVGATVEIGDLLVVVE